MSGNKIITPPTLPVTTGTPVGDLGSVPKKVETTEGKPQLHARGDSMTGNQVRIGAGQAPTHQELRTPRSSSVVSTLVTQSKPRRRRGRTGALKETPVSVLRSQARKTTVRAGFKPLLNLQPLLQQAIGFAA